MLFFFNSILVFSCTNAEFFYGKFLLTMLRSDSLTSLEFFSDKFLYTMISFDLSLSVTITLDDGAVISV